MSHSAMGDGGIPSALTTQASFDRLGPVRAAILALRQGGAVVLRAATPLMIVAAETASDSSLAGLAARGSGPMRVLLTGSRGGTLLGDVFGAADPVALWLPASDRQPDMVRGLADPVLEQAEQRWSRAPVPEAAAAALTLAKLARLLPALVATPVAAVAEADRRELAVVTPAEVLDFRLASDATLRLVAEARVPLEDAPDSRVLAFRGADGGPEHLAILIGQPEAVAAPLARIHSECFTGDALGSLRCDCGPQLRDAIRRMAQEGSGAVLYLAQEGRGIGLANKLRAYALQDRGLDTLEANRALGWEADERDFVVAAAMLRALGIVRVRLLTNNPDKVAALAAHGIAVERHSLLVAANGVNDAYLATKATRFGHFTT